MRVADIMAGVHVCWTPPDTAPGGGLSDLQAPTHPAVPGLADDPGSCARPLRERAQKSGRFTPR
ncbi:hypothetical protein [Streptomyces sp. TRM49041]|uniref:hypothetical protein n=1 Tax=Streptomyces sp. TRM49041 TaxID=2603216 RepID=UPI0011EDC41B|nr:hypothetical protein [Streptomyces sp. TRM49041]